MGTIPASQIVSIAPSVLVSGGTQLDAIGLVLTTSTRPQLGSTVAGQVAPSILSFPSAAAVASFFGATSKEATIAGGGVGLGGGYFGGFVGATKLPSAIYFAQYNTAAVAAYVRGGNVSALTLVQLQALSGTLSVTIDGYPRVGGSISLTGASSFSAAATTIQSALNAAPPTEATFTGSISGNTLTVTNLSTGTIAVGQTLTGTGAVVSALITAQASGSVGGTGTYTLAGGTQTVSSQALTAIATTLTVTYDSVSGAFVITSGITGPPSTAAFPTGTLAPLILLTQASGAVLSQGANATTPSTCMNAIVAQTTAFVTFGTAFDPDNGVGNTLKQAFAAWKNGQNNRYAYICWDTDITPTTTLPANASLGQLLPAQNDSGTCLIYETSDLNLMAFIMGTAASINFEGTNQRITFAFRSQAGLVGSVSDPTIAANLGGNPQGTTFGNNYNFYGAYAGSTAIYTWFQRGTVTGPFQWLDSYINQIVMNNAFQTALLTFLQNSLSVPYTVGGNALIAAALAPIITQFLNFGAFAPGVISAAQAQQVNGAAGTNIATTLQAQGYYLQILPASTATRLNRTSPPMTFWYLDRGSVQSVNLASIEVP